MKRGFTFVEIMVVVSILTMLTSMVMAVTAPARVQARDSKRTQDIHQIDLAVQQYISDHGHPPEWTSCEVQVNSVNSSSVSGCLAVSSSGLDGFPDTPTTAWGKFAKEIIKYMPNISSDPCTGSCTKTDGTSLAYTYMPPIAVNYYTSSSNGSYQLTAVLEKAQNSPVVSGSTGGDILTTPVVTVNIDYSPRPADHNYTVTQGINIHLGWSGTGFGTDYDLQKCGLSSWNGYVFQEQMLKWYQSITLFSTYVVAPLPRILGVSCTYKGKTYTDYVNLYI